MIIGEQTNQGQLFLALNYQGQCLLGDRPIKSSGHCLYRNICHQTNQRQLCLTPEPSKAMIIENRANQGQSIFAVDQS